MKDKFLPAIHDACANTRFKQQKLLNQKCIGCNQLRV